MKKNKKALSLVIAISIILVMSLLALYILEYMIPFSKNTKNIEQSVAAYYQADSGIEDALYANKQNISDLTFEKSKNISWVRDYSISMNSSWVVLPPVWEWNSEFDSNFNTINIWNPIQIEFWKNLISSFDDFKLTFRVPDLDDDSSTTESLKNGVKYINWQISSGNDILNSSWSQITDSEIDWNSFIIKSKPWRKLDDTFQNIDNFYTANCTGTFSGCILKMSVINKLELTDWTPVPYLEWKIENDSNIPLRYKIIKTSWKSYWFKKDLEVRIPQQTVNEAFDFTVFQ